jgi:energy-coupling factor transporter ATP-binding protein EcfA2
LPVASLQFTNLGPFDEVAFEFDPQVNVFIGPNNCGKTTALLAMGDLLIDALDIPRKLLRAKSAFSARFEGVPEYASEARGLFPTVTWKEDSWPEGCEFYTLADARKHLGYRTFIPALRLSTDFRSKGPATGHVTVSPTRTTDPSLHVLPMGEKHETVSEASVSSVRDERIIQRVIELDYRGYREGNRAIPSLITQIGSLASSITEGFPIKFSRVADDSDKRGLFLEFGTPDGALPLDVLSQGTQSLIQWCAQLLIGYAEYYDFPDTLRDKPGVLIIDEIDAHLHPSWQRRILPTLTREFPSLQIFCATHSPLTLAGLKAGQVQLLKRDAKGKVTVSRNQSDILGWSADEIYTNFLDVEPTDLDTATKLERLSELREKETPLAPAEKRELESLREEVHRGLLGGPLALQTQLLANQLKQAAKAAATSGVVQAARKGAEKSSGRSSKSTPSRRRGGNR